MQGQGRSIDIPPQDAFPWRPKGIALQHFLHGGRFFAVTRIVSVQGPEDLVNRVKGGPQDTALLVLRLG
jgi:hypothetical protein